MALLLQLINRPLFKGTPSELHEDLLHNVLISQRKLAHLLVILVTAGLFPIELRRVRKHDLFDLHLADRYVIFPIEILHQRIDKQFGQIFDLISQVDRRKSVQPDIRFLAVRVGHDRC